MILSIGHKKECQMLTRWLSHLTFCRFWALLCQSMALQHFVHLLNDGLWRDAVHAS